MKWWIALTVGVAAYVIYKIMYYLFGKFVKSDWLLRIICCVITVTICVGGLFLLLPER